jgi:hypothetical protein
VVEELTDPLPSFLDGALSGLAEQGFELGEDLLDGIEIGAVGGQEEELGAGPADGPSHRLAFVRSQIVHDDDVAWREFGRQALFDIGQEASAVDRTVEHAWRADPVVAQSRQEGESSPAAMRRLGDQPPASGAAAMGPRHVGLGPGLVDEDQAGRIKPSLILLPLRAPPGDVGPILLAGVQAFF